MGRSLRRILGFYSTGEWTAIILVGVGSALLNHPLIQLLTSGLGETVLTEPFGLPVLVTRVSGSYVPTDVLLAWTGYGAVAVGVAVGKRGAAFLTMSINGVTQVTSGAHLPHLLYGYKALGVELLLVPSVGGLGPVGSLVGGGLAEVFWFAVRGHDPLVGLGLTFIALRVAIRFLGGSVLNGALGLGLGKAMSRALDRIPSREQTPP